MRFLLAYNNNKTPVENLTKTKRLLHTTYGLPVLMKVLRELPRPVAEDFPPNPITTPDKMALLPPVQRIQ